MEYAMLKRKKFVSGSGNYQHLINIGTGNNTIDPTANG
jgi:hypothetical protein